MNQSYRTDLTDEQWEIIKTLIPAAKSGGRPRTVDMRKVINGIFYVLVAGCAWCMLPHDFPKWKTVYHYFRQWHTRFACPESSILGAMELLKGDWERIHEQLRKWIRAIEDRHPSPSAAVLDSQSVKTATMIDTEVGYDCAKQIKGRKRHVLVDTLGLLMVVVVTAANLPERAGAKLVFAQVKKEERKFWRLIKIWVRESKIRQSSKTTICAPGAAGIQRRGIHEMGYGQVSMDSRNYLAFRQKERI